MAGTVIRVGSGRGFVIETEHARYVLTAAHCLDRDRPLPLAFGVAGGDLDERTYAGLLGSLGAAAPNVWAECVFIDPIADLAVFGQPDREEFSDQAAAYEDLIDSAVPFVLGQLRLCRQRHLLRNGTTFLGQPTGTSEARMLSLEGEWFACRVTSGSRALAIEDAAQSIRSGMSGSPIILPDGSAVGLVCVGDGQEKSVTGNPVLSALLPAWLARDWGSFSAARGGPS